MHSEIFGYGRDSKGLSDQLSLGTPVKEILLRAEADAQALALINEQISQNPDLIQWRYVDTLSDNIDVMLLPSNSPFVFDAASLGVNPGN